MTSAKARQLNKEMDMLNDDKAATLEARVHALEVRLKFMESRMSSDMSAVIDMISAAQPDDEGSEITQAMSDQELGEFRIQLAKMSPKQHVAMQMVMDVRNNLEISEVVGVQENSAKMYVKNISSKMGLKFRGDVMERARRLMEFVGEDEYLRMSDGIPKHWWRDKVEGEPDPYAEIYKKPRKSE